MAGGLQNGTATLEDRFAVSCKTRLIPTTWSGKRSPWHFPKEVKNLRPRKKKKKKNKKNKKKKKKKQKKHKKKKQTLHPDVYSSFIHIYPNLEVTKRNFSN